MTYALIGQNIRINADAQTDLTSATNIKISYESPSGGTGYSSATVVSASAGTVYADFDSSVFSLAGDWKFYLEYTLSGSDEKLKIVVIKFVSESEFDEVFAMRLRIKDPVGYTSIELVDSVSSFPTTPQNQTLYFILELNEYRSYKGAWRTVNIELSNEQIQMYIDLYGFDKAIVKCVQDMVMALGKQLSVAQFNSGTESVVYQNLTTTYNFYKNMLAMLKEDIQESSGTNTGRFVPTLNARIGGVSEDTFEW